MLRGGRGSSSTFLTLGRRPSPRCCPAEVCELPGAWRWWRWRCIPYSLSPGSFPKWGGPGGHGRGDLSHLLSSHPKPLVASHPAGRDH